ncbi:redoxin domain-containing protein [Pelagicoccus sp. SDUM812002]|uniref:peroxiredoxin n=1 Tax=Pelagicoccus sp. SDUM812002 TaxID=3041266 RepID=UPI00280F2EF9|nr:redoxin domain-containing protein [Pelagicoccus sp. SDUM812002]MDQ8186407.1 redoxin domain-containing protein [Pelagicoccus sp. SDUM812002]
MVKVNDSLNLGFPVRLVAEGEKRECTFAEIVQRPTIVSVYMRNNTGSCDKQVKQMQVAAAELDRIGVDLIGVSKDTPGSHLKYACKLDLSFPLVSDPEHDFAQVTDSLVEKKMYGKTFHGPTRAAYLIDTDGKVLGIVEKVDSANHADQLIQLASDATTAF